MSFSLSIPVLRIEHTVGRPRMTGAAAAFKKSVIVASGFQATHVDRPGLFASWAPAICRSGHSHLTSVIESIWQSGFNRGSRSSREGGIAYWRCCRFCTNGLLSSFFPWQFDFHARLVPPLRVTAGDGRAFGYNHQLDAFWFVRAPER